jgi:hypothetical protein
VRLTKSDFIQGSVVLSAFSADEADMPNLFFFKKRLAVVLVVLVTSLADSFLQ